MTRSLLIIIGIFITLGLGLHFYAQWEMKRFEASLPNLPAPNGAATKGTGEAEKEKFDPQTNEEHWQSDEWDATPHPPELTTDEPQEKTVPKEHSPLVVTNVEAPELIEDPVAAQLHAEKLEMEQLQEEVNKIGNGFYNALEAQSLSLDEANAIFEKLNHKLQHLRERRHQWLSKYAEHYGIEYQGPEYWVNPQMVDEAVLQEQAEQEMQEQAASRGYIIFPGTPP